MGDTHSLATATAAADRRELVSASGWQKTMRQIWGLDFRSLAAFRIGLGLTLLADLGIRATYLVAHYTDAGVLPRAALLQMNERPYRFSLHFAYGETGPTAVLFLLHAVCAVLLAIGYRTRLMTVLCWLLLVSLHNRNPVLLNAGDQLLGLLLFWGIFLPLGARWAVDSHGRDHRSDPQPFVSAATVALIVQLCLVYICSAAHKDGAAWREGTALFYALHLDLFATRFGIWLRELGWPLKPLTYASYYWELLGPLLVFVPWCNSWFRTLAVAGFILFHAGIALAMNVGLFPLICIVGWIALIPGDLWDWLDNRFEVQNIFRRAWQNLLNPFLNRASTSGQERSGSIRLKPSVWVNGLVCLLLTYVVCWNLRAANFDRFEPYFPRALNPLGYALRLDQNWNMFAPFPTTDDGWFVFEAELTNGDVVDLARDGAPVTLRKPQHVLDWLPNRRWGKYLSRIKKPQYKQHRPHLAGYLTQHWNQAHDSDRQVEQLRIYFMREKTTDEGPLPPQMVLLWYHHAADAP